jgi:glycerol-3-phosphate dehydrogenase
MKRNLRDLSVGPFDLLVVGGGAFGAAAAWDAALRGLRVALVEQSDFGGGSSAECFKMVHGGIRYLQHADIRRLRASCAERSALLRIAPHLVSPLPIVIPTYGHGRQGKAFLAAGMYVYDALTLGKNAGIADRTRRIARTRLLSRQETLALFPDLEGRSLTGGAVFEDGQMFNTARLVLAFVKSAVNRGAVAVNYAQATEFLWDRQRVCGMRVRDRIDGSEIDVRAKLVLNAAGPWADYLLQDTGHFGAHRRGHFSRDACFLVNRKPQSRYALAVPGSSRDSDAMVSRAARHLFSVPWRDCTLIGVWHRVCTARPETARVEEAELASSMAEMNAAYPAMRLEREDVIYANCGLVPFGDRRSTAGELSFGKESRYIDHRVDGVEGLVSLIGIRYTTARGDSARALDLLLQQMPRAPARAPTDRAPLAGGDIGDFSALQASARREVSPRVPTGVLEAWLRNYGSEYRALAALAEEAPNQSESIGRTSTLAAEVTYAVRREMAMPSAGCRPAPHSARLRRSPRTVGDPASGALHAGIARLDGPEAHGRDRGHRKRPARSPCGGSHDGGPRAEGDGLMRILVTGGTGFIGSRLALEARRQGHAVTVAGQLNSDAERVRATELERVDIAIERGPLQDPAHARRIARGCEAVIHLAAAQHEANVPESYFFDVNVNGTRTLIDACEEEGVRRFVYGSTIGIYGESSGGSLDESSPPRPTNPYGRSKLEAERLGGSLQRSIVRISETYGPGDFRLLKLFRAVDRGRFLMIGSGLNRRQPIHVSDLVRGLLLAASHPAAAGETFVMAGEEILTTRELVRQIAGVLERPAPQWRLPMWPFLWAAVLMESTLAPLGIQPPLHRRRLDFFSKILPVLDRARSRAARVHTLHSVQQGGGRHRRLVSRARIPLDAGVKILFCNYEFPPLGAAAAWSWRRSPASWRAATA